MLTISIVEPKELEEFEIVIAGKRQITISINPKNLSLQIPRRVNPDSISSTSNSFFLRTTDM